MTIRDNGWHPADDRDDIRVESKYATVVKTCRMCDQEVSMSSDHGVCDNCASRMERGEQW